MEKAKAELAKRYWGAVSEIRVKQKERVYNKLLPDLGLEAELLVLEAEYRLGLAKLDAP